MRRTSIASGWTLCLLLAGCASPPAATVPAALQRAIAENNRAEQLYARGEYQAAIEHFRRALAAAEAVENEDAIAANLVNLSIVQHRIGERAAAIASAERVLNERNLRFPVQRLAEAALRLALLALEAGDPGTARKWTERAQSHCADPCALRAKMLGVHASLAIAAGDAPGAERFAREAVMLFRGRPEREELANGLRLLGVAATLRGEAVRGLAALAEALEIDKALALPRAIANDLIALGRAHASLGEASRARSFYERAIAVASADGNLPSVALAKSALAGLGESAASERDPRGGDEARLLQQMKGPSK